MFILVTLTPEQTTRAEYISYLQGRREKSWALMQGYDQAPVTAPFMRSRATKWHKLDVSIFIGSIVNPIYYISFLYPIWLDHAYHGKSKNISIKYMIFTIYQFKI